MSTTARATALPPDEPARRRIREDLASTLFVEAGAGSGKTTALVDRVVALVSEGAAELRNIAAITFTEKAAAELRDRVRRQLETRAAQADGEVAARCRLALDQLDGAAIGTLHAFARRILSEHPVEAELPPRIEVLDEVSSGIAFERRWAHTVDALLEDPALERTLLLLDAAGVRTVKLRALAQSFDASWDLIESRVTPELAAPGPLGPKLHDVRPAVSALVERCRECRIPDDGLVERIHEVSDLVDHAVAWEDIDAMELLCAEGRVTKKSVTRAGKKPNWAPTDIAEVRAELADCCNRIEAARQHTLQECMEHLGSVLREHTLAAAQERRQAGRLEFHDLLVLARKVLADPTHGPTVRQALHERYQRLLLDEFQDTDPIQIELAVRIAAAEPTGAHPDHWSEVSVAPGRLFVVGDPKQSIYRFRRADIGTFLEAKGRFEPEAGGPVHLTTNFRSVDPVIAWVNATFGSLMSEPDDEAIGEPSQPDYVALAAARRESPSGPPVSLLGRTEHPYGTMRADDLRAAEAADVAQAVTLALTQGWSVGDDGEPGGMRRARAGDITILVPARTSLPFLEDALEYSGIPFRAESSSLVYASRPIRDLLIVLRAADDPTDHLRVVSALRTPLLGCGDDDLFRFKVGSGGSWSYNGPEPPDPSAGIVEAGLAFLRDLHESRHWHSPSELLDRIVRDRRALELGFAEGRPRDLWRRIRFVIDQARAWSEATGGSLRAYLMWVNQQTVEGVRVTESVLPESDDDAVRIMTIHAAKGLEFPITIVSGMSTGATVRRAPVDVVFPRSGGVGYRLGRDVTTQEYEEHKPIDEQMSYHERIRLLYVACTRACDHLVVSLHRSALKNPRKLARNRTNAELLVAGMGDAADNLPDLGLEPGATITPLAPDPAAIPEPPPPLEAWAAERAERLESAGRPGAVAATALTDDGTPDPASDEGAAGLAKRPRDLDLPPWLKGRYGTAVGRAVHGALQTIDLAGQDGLDAIVSAQCHAEAIPERGTQVSALVTSALGSRIVGEAAVADHWREVYVCTPAGDRLLEGYVDLLYRSREGLVVVDYKTAATSVPEELDRRVEGYRLQGAAYALAVERSTGEPVSRVVFLFLTPDGAVERPLEPLEEALHEVERLVLAGDEVVLG